MKFIPSWPRITAFMDKESSAILYDSISYYKTLSAKLIRHERLYIPLATYSLLSWQGNKHYAYIIPFVFYAKHPPLARPHKLKNAVFCKQTLFGIWKTGLITFYGVIIVLLNVDLNTLMGWALVHETPCRRS